MLEKEPNVLVYELTKSRKEERLYKIVEFYRDQAAFDAHCATSYFQSQFAKLAAMLERPPEGDFLDAVDAWKVPARA